jgi:hypothetical protein
MKEPLKVSSEALEKAPRLWSGFTLARAGRARLAGGRITAPISASAPGARRRWAARSIFNAARRSAHYQRVRPDTRRGPGLPSHPPTDRSCLFAMGPSGSLPAHWRNSPIRYRSIAYHSG